MKVSMNPLLDLLRFFNYTERMKFLEKDLEEILFKQLTQNRKSLFKDGSEFYHYSKKWFRQLRIGNYGVADIVGYSRPLFTKHKYKGGRYHSSHRINIVELKKDAISLSAFLQVVRYAKGIERYFESKGIYSVRFNLILVGKTIDLNSDIVYLTDLFRSSGNTIHFYTYDYDFDGIKYTKIRNYKLTEEGFSHE